MGRGGDREIESVWPQVMNAICCEAVLPYGSRLRGCSKDAWAQCWYVPGPEEGGSCASKRPHAAPASHTAMSLGLGGQRRSLSPPPCLPIYSPSPPPLSRGAAKFLPLGKQHWGREGHLYTQEKGLRPSDLEQPEDVRLRPSAAALGKASTPA